MDQAVSSTAPGAPPVDTPQQREEKNINSLIAKHRSVIDGILDLRLEPEMQRQEMQKYGLDYDSLREHYKVFYDKGAELEKREAMASQKVTFIGWGATIVAGLSTFLLRNKITESKIVQGFSVGFASIFSGVIAGFLGSKFFTKNIRAESKELGIELRRVLEVELAIHIENKMNEVASPQQQAPELASPPPVQSVQNPQPMQMPMPVQQQQVAPQGMNMPQVPTPPTGSFSAGVGRKPATTARDANYTTQATMDKAATAAGQVIGT